MNAGLLLIASMFVVAGAATMAVGRRAGQLGVPVWLGKGILLAGGLMVLAGAGAILWKGVQMAAWLF